MPNPTNPKYAINSPYKVPVNNDLLDPLQGFDADVWVLDQGSGTFLLVGRFVSIQITIRNATEPYLEFNQRIPRMLDGEIQIGWILERGMLDSRVLKQTFGVDAITRQARLNRFPRFQITFSLNAAELHGTKNSIEGNTSNFGLSDPQAPDGNGFLNRDALARMRLMFCKVDTFTLGASSGRQVIANRWEGMCEGIEWVSGTNAGAGAAFDSVDIAAAMNTRVIDDTINPFPWDLDSGQSQVSSLVDGTISKVTGNTGGGGGGNPTT